MGTRSHMDNLVRYARLAADTLKDIADVSNVPFLSSVAGATLLILETIQTVKTNKDRCTRMLARIHQIMFAIIRICSTEKSELSPKMLDTIASFAETLQKFHSLLRAQQNSSKFRLILRKAEMSAELDACEDRFEGVLDYFEIQCTTTIAAGITGLRLDSEQHHQELLRLLADNDSLVSDESSLRGSLLRLGNSSSALSILPPQPKIFHGRDSELRDIVASLLPGPANVAVLGAGGIGKTTLAIAALHDPGVVAAYRHRHFVSCESAHSYAALMISISAHLEIEPSRQVAQGIVQYFAERDSAILVLDNLETAWEPTESRTEVEEFLSLLTDVPHLALLITMRGAEHPAKVKWSRPFLPALEPLTILATRATFVDIADEPCEEEEQEALAELISLTGCLPLAVSLMASVTSFEGYSAALARWSRESTALLSDGYDKRSNLDISIAISVSSPRLQSSAAAKQLLSLLSLLPDGITEDELREANLHIENLLQCKSTLLRTSLAYLDHEGRLKMLPPIRACLQISYPPDRSQVRSLRTHMGSLLGLWKTHRQLAAGALVPRLTSNLGNIRNLLLEGLSAHGAESKPELKDTCLQYPDTG
ncbi:hypothetical protein DFH09DRAFT_574681 [Mycena vulgaris]|nr:hypothetical protein DFH09DRAFT_574681 [Mycena vulgaris]